MSAWDGLADQTKEKFGKLKEEWTGFLSKVQEDPALQAGLVQFGLQATSPTSPGVNQLGASIAEGLGAYNRYQQVQAGAEQANLTNQTMVADKASQEMLQGAQASALFRYNGRDPWGFQEDLLRGLSAGGKDRKETETGIGNLDITAMAKDLNEEVGTILNDPEKGIDDVLNETYSAYKTKRDAYNTGRRAKLMQLKRDFPDQYGDLDVDETLRAENPFRLDFTDQKTADLFKRLVTVETNKDGTFKGGQLNIGPLDKKRLADILGTDTLTIAPAYINQIAETKWREDQQKKAEIEKQKKLDAETKARKDAARAKAHAGGLDFATGGSSAPPQVVPWGGFPAP